jgi:mRNA interferase MazF
MKRGEIVILDFPYSDGSGSKNRPAVVVQADEFNKAFRDTILATITTNTQPLKTSVVIEPGENPRSGLNLMCAVRCDNIRAIDQRLVLGSVGYLSKQTMQKLDQYLKMALGLS